MVFLIINTPLSQKVFTRSFDLGITVQSSFFKWSNEKWDSHKIQFAESCWTCDHKQWHNLPKRSSKNTSFWSIRRSLVKNYYFSRSLWEAKSTITSSVFFKSKTMINKLKRRLGKNYVCIGIFRNMKAIFDERLRSTIISEFPHTHRNQMRDTRSGRLNCLFKLKVITWNMWFHWKMLYLFSPILDFSFRMQKWFRTPKGNGQIFCRI